MKVYDEVTPTLKKLSKEFNQQELNKNIVKVASEVRNDILKRTVSGKDYKGKSFTKYNPRYAIARSKAGKTTNPNLTWKADMLRAMHVKPKSNGAYIGNRRCL